MMEWTDAGPGPRSAARARRLKHLFWLLPLCLLAACQNRLAPPDDPTLDLASRASYEIAPLDRLQVFVWRAEDLSVDVPVRPDGWISLPLVGEMRAAGKAPDELADEIEQELRTFVQNPVVSVIVTGFGDAAGQTVRVIGEAGRPAAVPYRAGLRVLDVMVTVGGLSEFAAGNDAVLIETGPATTTPALCAGLKRHGVEPGDIRDILVTHIHLDHAGAAGWWAQQGARVHVHPVGAPHLVDPSKLIKSATRIYGALMDSLWGEILPAPEERVIAVEDGQRLKLGGVEIEVLDTPGHAWHHHVYAVGDVAFAGDATGIKLPDHAWIDIPAPPPEFDLEAWRRTLTRLRERNFSTLYRTHFGAGGDPGAELVEFEAIIERAAESIRGMMAEGLTRDEMIERFTEQERRRGAAAGADAETAHAYELANPRRMSVDGIRRYWTKRAERESAQD